MDTHAIVHSLGRVNVVQEEREEIKRLISVSEFKNFHNIYIYYEN